MSRKPRQSGVRKAVQRATSRPESSLTGLPAELLGARPDDVITVELSGRSFEVEIMELDPAESSRTLGRILKQAMFDAARFWLDLGVDGFRLDAIGTIFEDPALPDQTAELSLTELHYAYGTTGSEEERVRLIEQQKAMFQCQRDLPLVHNLMRELLVVIDECPGRVMVGETESIAYYGDGQDEREPVLVAERDAPGLR